MADGRRVVLVTGGNRGIGLEVVKAVLAEDGGHVVVMGCRDLQAGRRLSEELAKTYGDRIEPMLLEVTCADSAANVAEQIRTKFGRLDVLVNNAGVLLEGDGAPFSMESVRETLRVNFEGVVVVTEACLPLLQASPGGGEVLSTSSGTATRAMARLRQEHREALSDPGLDLPALRAALAEISEALANPNCAYHDIPTVGYSLSKVGVNCYTQILARRGLRANACSPGFCDTGMCANYTGARRPKAPALGASVFREVLFREFGRGRTSCFFKEASKPGTPLSEAVSVAEPWVAPLEH